MCLQRTAYNGCLLKPLWSAGTAPDCSLGNPCFLNFVGTVRRHKKCNHSYYLPRNNRDICRWSNLDKKSYPYWTGICLLGTLCSRCLGFRCPYTFLRGSEYCDNRPVSG